MLLSITHRTVYRYDPPAARCALRLKLHPSNSPGQEVRSWSVTVNGEPTSARITNGYGDDESIWLCHHPTEEVEVIAAGEVSTTDMAGVLRAQALTARPAMFLRGTELTEPDVAIRKLAKKAVGDKTGLDAAHALAVAVGEALEYKPDVTDAATTAAEALKLEAGVCQDYAHVLIAGARALGAAARYVVGYLYVPPAEAEETIVSATETHAWAEIWVDGLGWVGFDPSNGVCPTDHYVRLASGLDAPDAAPLRGTVMGAPEESLEAHVQVVQTQQ